MKSPQNLLNLEHVGFPDTGGIWPFHVEYRFPDAELSPTSITAKTFLFLAMLIKAVDLSQYGVIHVGKIGPWRRKIEIMNMLSNNDGDLAASDTRGITDDVIEELRVGCRELLDLLNPAFSYLKNDAVANVLAYLAETPISLMRCAGYDWDGIELLLSERACAEETGFDDVDRKIMQCIEFGEWVGIASPETWHWLAAREFWLTPSDLERRLNLIGRFRGLSWDEHQGTMVFSS